jgi:adenylate cyclase
MTDIFVSYRREDRPRVLPIVEALEALGWSVWWDTRLQAGAEWDAIIEAELEKAKCILVVWSESAVQSRWVRTEAHIGMERNCLVPIRLDMAKIPIAFHLIQTADFSSWNGDTGDATFALLRQSVSTLLHQLESQPSKVELIGSQNQHPETWLFWYMA